MLVEFKMSPRERILRTFQNKATDKVPIYHVGFSSEAASIILGREAYVGGYSIMERSQSVMGRKRCT